MLLTSYTIVLTEGSLMIVWVNVVFFKNCCSWKWIWSDIFLTTIKSKANGIGIKNSKTDDILFLLNRIKFLVVSALNCCIKYYKQMESSKIFWHHTFSQKCKISISFTLLRICTQIEINSVIFTNNQNCKFVFYWKLQFYFWFSWVWNWFKSSRAAVLTLMRFFYYNLVVIGSVIIILLV